MWIESSEAAAGVARIFQVPRLKIAGRGQQSKKELGIRISVSYIKLHCFGSFEYPWG